MFFYLLSVVPAIWFLVFFYLLSVVPAIWFLELHEMERRIEEEKLRRNKTLTYQLGNATAYQLVFVNTVPGLEVRQHFV